MCPAAGTALSRLSGRRAESGLKTEASPNNTAMGNAEAKGYRTRLFFRVFCFTLGISGAFFVLGLGASAAGEVFITLRDMFLGGGGGVCFFFGVF